MLEKLEARRTPLTITRTERIGSHIQKVVLTAPPITNLHFPIGSYIQPMINNRVPRAYTVAEAHDNSCTIIVSFSGQGVGARFFQNAQVGTTVNSYGPFDDFPYHYGTGRSKVFLATGTGVAPFVAMAQEAVREQLHSLLVLGVPEVSDIPYAAEFEALAQSSTLFTFTPTLSRPTPQWPGARGYVTQQFQSREAQEYLRKSDVYVCGVPGMVTSTRKMLKELQVPKKQIYIQKFG